MTPRFDPTEPSKTCPFAKHKGELWVEVVTEDTQYVEWLISGEDDVPEISEDLYEYLTELVEDFYAGNLDI